MGRLTPRYQFVYADGGISKPYGWRELLRIIRSRAHYGLRLPESVERVI